MSEKKPAIITYEDLLEKRFPDPEKRFQEFTEEEFKTAYKEFVKSLKKITFIDNGNPKYDIHTTIQDKLADVDSSSDSYTSEKTEIFKMLSGSAPTRNDGNEINQFLRVFYPPPDAPVIPIYKNTGTKKDPKFEPTGETIPSPYENSHYDTEDRKKASATYWRWSPVAGYTIKPCNGVKDKLGENDFYSWIPSEKKCVLDEVTKGRFWGENRNASKESLFQTQKKNRENKKNNFKQNAKKVVEALRKKIEKSKKIELCDTCGEFIENNKPTISEIREFLQNKGSKPCVCKNHIQEYLKDLLKEKQKKKKGGTKKRKTKKLLKTRKQNTKNRKTRKIV